MFKNIFIELNLSDYLPISHKDYLFTRKSTMSTTTATHKHLTPKNAKREVIFMIFITLVPWPVLTFAFPNIGFTINNMIIAMLVFGALTLLLWYVGYSRRKNSELFASMNDEINHIQVWMRKSSTAWAGKLSISTNEVDLNEVTEAKVEKINGNRTLVLTCKNKGGAFYLPQRLAVQPEVKSFFSKWLALESTQLLPFRTLIEKFINGDEGIIEKDPAQVAKKTSSSQTISELLEEQSQKNEAKSLNEILAEEERLRKQQETNR